MNSVRSNNLSLNYQRLTPLGCKDKGIRTFFGVNSIPFSTFKIRFKLKFTWVLTFHRNLLNLSWIVKKISQYFYQNKRVINIFSANCKILSKSEAYPIQGKKNKKLEIFLENFIVGSEEMYNLRLAEMRPV